jgi:hypothetical protein
VTKLSEIKEKMNWQPKKLGTFNKLPWEQFERIVIILQEENGDIDKALPRVQEFRKVGKFGLAAIRVEICKAVIQYPEKTLKEYYDEGRKCRAIKTVRGAT